MAEESATILVVDDDEDIREFLQDRLEFLSYRVLTATDGVEGLERIRSDRPDLVLLDIRMPNLDGFGVLKGIAEEELEATVVMITAHGSVQAAVQAMQEGAFNFLQKPFQPEDIERTVKHALERSRLIKENQRLEQELAEAKDRLISDMQGELQAAHDMQMDLLPAAPPTVEGMELSGICIPAKEVGGDYYAFLENLSEDGSRLGIVLADVSGKGMQAATVAMRFNEMLRYEVIGRSSTLEVLNGLDRSLRGRIPEVMFVTCGIGILDLTQRSLTLASAANPEVYHFRQSEATVRPLELTGYPLGLPIVVDDSDLFSSIRVDLSSGDLLVFTSDGVEEARNEAEEFYGEARLKMLVHTCGLEGASAETVRDKIVSDVVQFMGGSDQTDDITVIVLRVV